MSNPNLGETVILTQGRTASPLGLSDINGAGIYLKKMDTKMKKFLVSWISQFRGDSTLLHDNYN